MKGGGWRDAAPVHYLQGYLSGWPGATVRIRIAGEEAFLTIKSPSRGAVREEWEYPVPPDDAREMLTLSMAPPVEKLRRKIPFEGFIWEVDEFLGENKGLLLAEIELESETQAFSVPSWVGMEVTGDKRFYNSSLSRNPYSRWEDAL